MSGYSQTFSHSQLRALDIAARVSSCLSLTGSSFTILTFSFYPPLRKPVNRLAFSIAIANIFACLAYSWGQYPVKAGRNSAWCQTQGFFINWFVMTDPLLVMIMAFNVLLTVRTKRNALELKRVDVYAVLLAFLLPFIPALVFLCWRPDGKPLYGPATLWCWIGKEKSLLRLVAFYVPIWCFILTAIILFALSGKQILLVRKKVKAAKTDNALTSEEPALEQDSVSVPRERRFSSFAKAFLAPTRTRESARTAMTSSTNEQSDTSASAEPKGLETLAPIQEVLDLESHNDQYSRGLSTVNDPNALFTTPSWQPDSPTATLDRATSDQAMLRTSETQHPSRRAASRFDSIHWKYAKFAFLCTIVLFITWVPISVNRVYNNFISPDHQIYGLYLTSAACIPLHGFGNFIIYAATSWTEVKECLTCAGRARGASRRGSLQQVQEDGSRRMSGMTRRKMQQFIEKQRSMWKLPAKRNDIVNGNENGNRNSFEGGNTRNDEPG